MELKLKICGMRDPGNVEQVSSLNPDYLGLIFYEGSPRFVADKIGKTPKNIKKVGVFVNASEGDILEKVRKHELSAVQLHGGESPEFCSRLQKYFSEAKVSPKIIKVFSIEEKFDFNVLKGYEKSVDFFLFDTKGKQHGGNGFTFNWDVLRGYTSATPFFLSGGIGPEEIPAIRNMYEYFLKNGKKEIFFGVDVNSKFEDKPGVKNVEKLKTFRESLFSEDKK